MVEKEKLRQETLRQIKVLQSKANRGLWALALFVTLSIGAYRNFDFLPSFPDSIHRMLGSAPPTNWINTALVLYSFSAIILILSRMMGGSGSYGGITHVGYLAAFYAFYHFAGAIEENFLAVFAAGITVLGLESYHIWTHFMESVRQAQEALARQERALEHRSTDGD